MRSVSNSNYNNLSKTTGKISALWICRILFFGCFFVAIFVANTIWKNEAAWMGYLHENSVLSWIDTNVQDVNNIIYILLCRLPIWLAILIFGRILFGVVLAAVYAGWQGFVIGFVLSAFIMRYGVMGILIFIFSSCPQILLYVLAYWLLYRMICKLYREKRRIMYLGESGVVESKVSTGYVGACFVLSTIFLTGVFLESYVNVLLLEKIARIVAMF